LIDDIQRSLLTAIEKPAFSSLGPIEKLEAIFLSHVSNAEERKGMTSIVIHESLMIREKKIKRKMLSVMARYQEILKTVLKEGIKHKKINDHVDIDAAGIAFFGMVQAAVVFWGLSDYSYRLKDRTLERMFQQYIKGLCA
jgi:YsiA-like protein, C-terminal region